MKKGDTCQEEWYRPTWAISKLCFTKINKSEWLSNNKEPNLLIKEFLILNPKVSYIDTFSLLCPSNTCKNYDQNSFLYLDKHHLTSYGAMKSREIIESTIFTSN